MFIYLTPIEISIERQTLKTQAFKNELLLLLYLKEHNINYKINNSKRYDIIELVDNIMYIIWKTHNIDIIDEVSTNPLIKKFFNIHINKLHMIHTDHSTLMNFII